MSPFSSAEFRGSLKDLFAPDQILHLMRVEFDRAQRYHYPLVLLVIAVDRITQLQDLYGSGLREQIHEAMIGMLRTGTRASDSIGCLMDERILVLVPHTPADGASAMAKRVLEGLRALTFDCDGRPTRVTVSIGGAHNAKKGELNFDTLLEVAEAGLKVARDGGGNRYVHSDLYEFFERKRAKEAEEARRNAPPPAVPAAAAVDANNPLLALAEKIREMFGLSERDNDLLARIEDEVVSRTLREMKSELERVLQDSKSEHRRQVEALERRISKLSTSLGLTEAELQRVLSQKNVDPGVASIYKTVQGLSSTDVQAELKRALMSKIFEANVELRKRIGTTPGPQT
jgi:diguanylate cyclase (GGDEF)-like protein